MTRSNDDDVVSRLTEQLRIYVALDRALERWLDVARASFEAESTEALRADLMVLLDIEHDQASAVLEMQVRRVPRDQRRFVADQCARILRQIEKAQQQLSD